MTSEKDQGWQFSKFQFPCNKEEILVLNYFFRELFWGISKNFKLIQGSLLDHEISQKWVSIKKKKLVIFL